MAQLEYKIILKDTTTGITTRLRLNSTRHFKIKVSKNKEIQSSKASTLDEDSYNQIKNILDDIFSKFEYTVIDGCKVLDAEVITDNTDIDDFDTLNEILNRLRIFIGYHAQLCSYKRKIARNLNMLKKLKNNLI